MDDYDYPLKRYHARPAWLREDITFTCYICGAPIPRTGVRRVMRGSDEHERRTGGRPFCIVCSDACATAQKALVGRG
jgi:hypothetical protein